MSSLGLTALTPKAAPTCARARFRRVWASCPKPWREEGLPKWVMASVMAAMASGQRGVVAELSRYMVGICLSILIVYLSIRHISVCPHTPDSISATVS